MESDPTLKPLPPDFAVTVTALHRVAEEIVAPARKPDNEIALRATPGGFGTPPFEFEDQERQVRVERDELVYQVGADERRTTLTSLAAAGALVEELLPADVDLDDRPLGVDPPAAEILAAWYQLGNAVLADLVAEAGPGEDPSEINLWPEHFDLAIELGAEADDQRATYGFSPGDDDHPEPYAYVAPWAAEIDGDLWRATGFRGAELGYTDLLEADDPHAAALEFCRTRKRALASTG